MTDPHSDLTVILPDRLIDGVAESPQEGMAVGFSEGRVLWVGKRGDVENSQSDTPREILEYPGATLLPGLFDLHTHTNMPGDGRTGEEVERDDTDDVRLLRAASNVAAALSTGVTSLCDCGSWNRTAYSLKKGTVAGPGEWTENAGIRPASDHHRRTPVVYGRPGGRRRRHSSRGQAAGPGRRRFHQGGRFRWQHSYQRPLPRILQP